MATFVLVHGSMHGGWCWKRVAPLLRVGGHEVVAPTLTGLGERCHLAHPVVDLDTHIQDVLAVLECEELRDVVLVGHSYGASVITGVADRAPDRIAQLVFLNGVMPSDGQALLDFYPPDWGASRQARVVTEGEGWQLPPPPDLTPLGVIAADDLAWVRPRLVPQPFKTFTQPLRLMNPVPFAGPKSFIACNGAPPAAWRDTMVARARAEPGWRSLALPTGHDAMVTMPRELAELLLEFVRES